MQNKHQHFATTAQYFRNILYLSESPGTELGGGKGRRLVTPTQDNARIDFLTKLGNLWTTILANMRTFLYGVVLTLEQPTPELAATKKNVINYPKIK